MKEHEPNRLPIQVACEHISPNPLPVDYSVPRAGIMTVAVAGQSGAGCPNMADKDHATAARAVQEGQMLLRSQPPGSSF